MIATMILTLQLVAGGSGRQVALAWDANAEPLVTGYSVYRSLVIAGTAGSFAKIGTTAALTYADTSVIPGEAYDYQVKAFLADGTESPASNTVRVSIAAFGAPTVAVVRDTVPPIITKVAIGGVTIPKGGTFIYTGTAKAITIAVSATDNQGIQAAQLTVYGRVLLSIGAIWGLPPTFSLVWQENLFAVGDHTAVITVFDGAGNSSSFDFVVKK